MVVEGKGALSPSWYTGLLGGLMARGYGFPF